MNYKVIEIFDSLDGEGIRIGQPVTFVRMYGCNLRCSYCDTIYSYDGTIMPTSMSENQILKKLNSNYKRVTLTGGEPLCVDGINQLIQSMCKSHSVNIETNGAVDITSLINMRKIEDLDIMFSIDYKLLSSTMSGHMIENNFDKLGKKDIVKFVVGSDKDVSQIIEITRKHKLNEITNIFIGAVYGQYELRKLANIIMNTPILADARLQIQLHKIVGIA